jgi:general nucleoside transport system permease protein
MSINLLALIGAMLTIATPLVWAGIGEVIVERGGVLNLGIEGTM